MATVKSTHHSIPGKTIKILADYGNVVRVEYFRNFTKEFETEIILKKDLKHETR